MTNLKPILPFLFLSNVEGIVVDNAVFSLSTALTIPETFALKI